MRRILALLSVAALLQCFSPIPILATQRLFTTDHENQPGTGPRPSRQQVRPRGGVLVVEVDDISTGDPVSGIRVELLQTGQTQTTDSDGRVRFVLPAGEYDVRAYDLSGPGPARRNQDAHATVLPRTTVVVQVFDCQLCV